MFQKSMQGRTLLYHGLLCRVNGSPSSLSLCQLDRSTISNDMPIRRFTARRAILLVTLVLVCIGRILLPSYDESWLHFDWGDESKRTSPDYSQLLANYPLLEPDHTLAEEQQIISLETPSPLSHTAATALCAQVDLKPYPNRGRRRKVYDLFTIGTELDWVEIRLETLSSEVDYFVIVESTRSFTKSDKPLYFKKNWHRFAKFESKILHHVLNDDAAIDFVLWDREHYQRDAMLAQVFPSLLGRRAPEDGDVLIVADVDEIPRPETIVKLRNCDFPDRTTLMSRFFLYSFSWKRGDMDWYHPQATFWQGNKTILPESLRMDEAPFRMHNASWHCTSCFRTVAELVSKINSFSHAEFNKPEYKDPDGIVRRVRNGIDIFERNFDYVKIASNELDLPDFLAQNQHRFRYLIDRDPVTANFEDYAVPDA